MYIYSYIYIPVVILSILKRELPIVRPYDLSLCMWGLSVGGLEWDELPLDVRWSINCALRRVGMSMSTQDVANCAYGLAVMCFDSENIQVYIVYI